MADPRIKIGSVVQIDPMHDIIFGGSFMIVTDVKSWGVKGYVSVMPSPHAAGGLAYYRVPFDKIAYVGEAEWKSE